MWHDGGGRLGKRLAFTCAALLAAVGVGRADELADLKARLEAQEREIRELRSRVDAAANDGAKPDAKADGKADGKGGKDAKGAKKEEKKLDEKAVNKMIDDYLKSTPGAGMPPGVQTGFELNKGWFIRSPDNPSYVPWDDLSKIPFEMRIRGRIQMPYYFYKTTDSVNHLTRVDTFNNTSPDFDQLEIKRMRLIFEGSAYDPDLRYHIQFDGNTRGLTGTAGGGEPGTTGLTAVGNVPGGNTITTVDHAVRLFSAFVAYDFQH